MFVLADLPIRPMLTSSDPTRPSYITTKGNDHCKFRQFHECVNEYNSIFTSVKVNKCIFNIR